MGKRRRASVWPRILLRQFDVIARQAAAAGARALVRAVVPKSVRAAPPPGAGSWTLGVVFGTAGARRYRLYRPPGIGPGERLPLLVMLHGCGQDANSFAASTRMNRVAQRERFLVLYPEQDRLAHAQGCWNWYDIDSGRAYGEVALILNAIDQVCLLQPVDRSRVAVAGLSAGASMAALLATRHPDRFGALVMHSGIPPGAAHSGLSALTAMQGRRSSSRRASDAVPSSPRMVIPMAAATAPPWPPLQVIHGDADAVVSPRNGRAAACAWALAAGAHEGPPQTLTRGQRHPMQVTDFKRSGRTVARLVVVKGLSHAWSGGAARQPFSDSRGPDASRLTWAFAARQFRAGAAARGTKPPRRSRAPAIAPDATNLP